MYSIEAIAQEWGSFQHALGFPITELVTAFNIFGQSLSGYWVQQTLTTCSTSRGLCLLQESRETFLVSVGGYFITGHQKRLK